MNFAEIFDIRKLESLGLCYVWCYLRDPSFSRFSRTPTCDGQTDTRRHMWIKMAYYCKKPDLVELYVVWPGNGSGLFLQLWGLYGYGKSQNSVELFSVVFRSADDDVYMSSEHQTRCAQTFLIVLQQPFTANADDLNFSKVHITWFLVTICKTVRPMLSDCCPVLSVCL